MKAIIRLGSEIVIKSSRVRNQFVSRLKKNIKTCFRSHGYPLKLVDVYSRLTVEVEERSHLELLKKIFGIHSYSELEFECESSLEAMEKLVWDQYKDAVAGKRFAVRCKRRGHHTYSSVDVARRLGRVLNKIESVTVDLTNPEWVLEVEIDGDQAWFFTKKIPGARGLPLGTAGKALCLFSGGFDSAVAAYNLQRRGVETDYLLCNLAGDAYEQSVIRVAKALACGYSHGGSAQFYTVDFRPLVAELKERVHPRYHQVLLKRMFLRAGERFAQEKGYCALITGEVIGQVSSQTLINLQSIEDAISMPVFRPLIGTDKEDIIAQARVIGTHDTSEKIVEFCQLTSAKPATACSIEKARREEDKVDLRLIDQLELKAISLRKIQDENFDHLFLKDVPENAVIIDCRPQQEYKKKHIPGALSQDYHLLMRDFNHMYPCKLQTYLVYCGVGMQSVVLAENMQKKGYEVYSLKGGFDHWASSQTELH